MVERRYSEFRAFRRLLRKRLSEATFASLGRFPPKSYLFRLAASTIDARQAGFQRFLDSVLQLRPLPPELNDFLEVPNGNSSSSSSSSSSNRNGNGNGSSGNSNSGGRNGSGRRRGQGSRHSNRLRLRTGSSGSSSSSSSSISERLSSYEDADRGYMVNPDIG